MFSRLKQFEENLRRKVSMSLAHIQTWHGYDFPLYFPQELLMSLILIGTSGWKIFDWAKRNFWQMWLCDQSPWPQPNKCVRSLIVDQDVILNPSCAPFVVSHRYNPSTTFWRAFICCVLHFIEVGYPLCIKFRWVVWCRAWPHDLYNIVLRYLCWVEYVRFYDMHSTRRCVATNWVSLLCVTLRCIVWRYRAINVLCRVALYVTTPWHIVPCYIDGVSEEVTLTSTGWIIVTWPYLNLNVSRTGNNFKIVARGVLQQHGSKVCLKHMIKACRMNSGDK